MRELIKLYAIRNNLDETLTEIASALNDVCGDYQARKEYTDHGLKAFMDAAIEIYGIRNKLRKLEEKVAKAAK